MTIDFDTMEASRKIEEYYDTGAFLTADSDPAEEYDSYLKCCENEPKMEFEQLGLTLEDFEEYIKELKKFEEWV